MNPRRLCAADVQAIATELSGVHDVEAPRTRSSRPRRSSGSLYSGYGDGGGGKWFTCVSNQRHAGRAPAPPRP